MFSLKCVCSACAKDSQNSGSNTTLFYENVLLIRRTRFAFGEHTKWTDLVVHAMAHSRLFII